MESMKISDYWSSTGRKTPIYYSPVLMLFSQHQLVTIVKTVILGWRDCWCYTHTHSLISGRIKTRKFWGFWKGSALETFWQSTTTYDGIRYRFLCEKFRFQDQSLALKLCWWRYDLYSSHFKLPSFTAFTSFKAFRT